MTRVQPPSQEPSAEANIVALFDRQAARVPDRQALLCHGKDPDGSPSFAELRDASARLATGLGELGLRAGDRAIVMVPMSAELYTLLLALWRLGAVAIFADPWVSPRDMAAMAAFAEPRAFIGTPKSHLTRLFQPTLRRLPITVTTGRLFSKSITALSRRPPLTTIAPVRPGDPALITFTSGSSGRPKGANRTHGFLRAQHEVLGREFPHHDGEVELTSLPIFALHNLAQGLTTVLPPFDLRRIDRSDAGLVIGQAQEAGVTTLTTSPPFFDRLAADSAMRLGAFRPRRLLTGGAPVSDVQLRTWRSAFPRAKIVIAYGSTEAEPVAHIDADERLGLTGRQPGYCVGRPVAPVSTKVVPIHRLGGLSEITEMDRGGIGELIVSGEHVCRDYFRNAAAARENKFHADGRLWHRMGDTGSFDVDGRFWIAGRVHSTLFRAGQAVHAQLIEQAARGGDIRIRRAAAIGLADLELGEKVLVMLELAPSMGRDREGLVEGVRKRLRAARQPYDEILIARRPLPLDPRHRSKVDYSRLRRRITAYRLFEARALFARCSGTILHFFAASERSR